MRICRTCPALGGLFVTLFFVATAHANWPAEATSDGAPICTASGTQARLRPAVSDGYGGVLVAWEDWRSLSTTGPHPYAQRLSQSGDAVWTADGVALSAVSGRQQHVSCIADGIGGAFVAWADSVLGTACVQHLNAVGVPQWSPNGMLVTTDVSSSLLLPTLMLDGAGGVFVVWGGRPSGVRTLRMQRLNANGVRLWGPLGLQLATVFAWAYDGFSPVFQLLPDNTGGCIALWGSFDPALQLHAFAQRVTASGSPQWPAGGVPLSTTHQPGLPSGIPDGAGGVIVSYWDADISTVPTTYSIRAQRLSSLGALLWGPDGVAISTLTSLNLDPAPIIAAPGGAYVGWEDQSSGTAYVQRVSSAGVPAWPAGGVQIASGGSLLLNSTDDGHGGIVACWQGAAGEVRTQRLDASGAALWTAGGVPVFTAPGTHIGMIVRSLDMGFVYIACSSLWFGTSFDNGSIFAKFVMPSGSIGPSMPVIAYVRDVPGDQGGKMLVAWNASEFEQCSPWLISSYTVMQRSPGALTYLPVATIPAYGLSGYGYVASSFYDSSAAGNLLTSFAILANNNSMILESAPVAGYSIDNLPPYPPSPLPPVVGAGGLRLRWSPNNDADLAGYRLYRGNDPAFTPAAGNLIASLGDTGYVDPAGPGATFKLTAVDRGGNESAPVTLTSGSVLGVTPSAQPREVALAAPSPNPMRSGVTTLRFALPTAGPVRLALYDAAGRRVRDLAGGVRDAGEYTLTFDGRGNNGYVLSAGLYFLRFEAAGRVITRHLAKVE